MKCPKCGYLGFETTDRCRNCGYDFSLAAPVVRTELPLRGPALDAPLDDLELRDDLLLGEPEDPVHERQAAGFGRTEPRRVTPPVPAAPAATPPAAPLQVDSVPADECTEDLPLFAPRPAGTPLAVRRPGHDVPKARRTTTRPMRMETPAVLPLVPEPSASEVERSRPARTRVPDIAGLGRRIAAAGVDLLLLVGIDVGVVWLTLRIAGLAPTSDSLGVIRPVPMVAFLLVLAFLYFTGFTVGGGQTIGKMLMGIRVTGDDGRGVDITGAVVRALGCLAAIATFGLLFVPAFFGPERRAVHDRLAGTRVVIG